jgi:FKBP-type peptidyl-prolyl cis-trans isomerase FklB
MKKWGMALGILLLAVGLCAAEEPAAKTDKAPEAGTVTEKAPDQKAPDAAALGQKGPDAAATEQKAAETPVKVDMDKVSYIIGMWFGKDMKTQGIELNAEPFLKGLKDSISGANSSLTEEETQQMMTAFRNELDAKKAEQTKKLSEESKAKEEAFLSANQKKDGVKALPSGLQYKVVKDGAGKKPTSKDSVTVNYRGSLIDGKEFDSSYKRNEPATFPVGGVIPGWTEALQLMKSGSKWEIYIPSKLAYGEAGVGEVIPPNATLIFEVELLSVTPGEEKKAATPKAGAQTKAKAVKSTAKTAGQATKSGN